MNPILYLVVPCYNEEKVLEASAQQLGKLMQNLAAKGQISPQSRILFVNDGSSDRTLSLLEALHSQDKLFSYVSLSRNYGHQNALFAGLMTAKDVSDITISMDADLQDDISVIPQMVERYAEGYQVVYGVREDRSSDGFFKRCTAQGYYKLLARLGCQVEYNHADCRLLSRRALEALADYPERSLFLRGMVPLIGFPSATVTYRRRPRLAGETKYSTKKMLNLAADGITALSVKPLRMIFFSGLILLLLALLLLIFSLVHLAMGHSMLNWKIVTFAILAVGGILLLALGIIGEYVGKILFEVKHRPRYIIDKVVNE